MAFSDTRRADQQYVTVLVLAQQRYVKSHRNLLRSPHSGPRPGTPYRPIRMTGVRRALDSFCFRGLKWPMARRPPGGHLNLLGEYDFSEDKLQDSVGIKLPKLTD